MRRTACLIAWLLWFAPLLPGEDDAPADADPSPMRHRVTGLYCPERQDDLRAVMKELRGITLVKIDYRNSEASFLYDAGQVFPKAKPEEIPNRFDKLLKSASHATFGIRPLCSTPKGKLEFVEIPVIGLDCKACGLGAYETIIKIDGVEQATASFRDGLVTAWIDPKKTDRSALETALKRQGVPLQAPAAGSRTPQ